MTQAAAYPVLPRRLAASRAAHALPFRSSAGTRAATRIDRWFGSEYTQSCRDRSGGTRGGVKHAAISISSFSTVWPGSLSGRSGRASDARSSWSIRPRVAKAQLGEAAILLAQVYAPVDRAVVIAGMLAEQEPVRRVTRLGRTLDARYELISAEMAAHGADSVIRSLELA